MRGRELNSKQIPKSYESKSQINPKFLVWIYISSQLLNGEGNWSRKRESKERKEASVGGKERDSPKEGKPYHLASRSVQRINKGDKEKWKRGLTESCWWRKKRKTTTGLRATSQYLGGKYHPRRGRK